MLRRARAVASYMQLERPDCVVPHLPRAETATLLACRMTGERPPIVPTVHGDVHYRSYRNRLRSRRLFHGAAHFVGVSRGVSDSLAAAVAVPGENITTIYNPVVTPEVHVRAAEQPGHPWLLDGDAPVILAAGRSSKEKDYPTLLRAFARLVGQRPCRLVILGQGEKKGELEGLAQDLAVAHRVSFAGWVENPFAFMSRASLFVLSSIHEGFAMVLVEAMACGCPCVSTDCPAGPAEVLEDGKYGPLVPVGDEAALAEAMGRVLDQPPEKPVLRQRAADFSVDRAVDAYEQLIESLVVSHNGRENEVR